MHRIGYHRDVARLALEAWFDRRVLNPRSAPRTGMKPPHLPLAPAGRPALPICILMMILDLACW